MARAPRRGARPPTPLSTHLYAGCEATLEDLPLDGGGSACILSRRSPAKDATNEDAAAVLVHGEATALIVADGLGGRPNGAEAAHTAVRTLCDRLRAAGFGSPEAADPESSDLVDPGALVLEALAAANREVIARDPEAATTLAVVAISAGVARAYHVGDVGVLIVGGRGRVRLQTVPHSPVGYALGAGLIDERAAMAHDARHFVSNVVGDPQMHIEASAPIALRARDRILIASDGLFDNMYTSEIVARLRVGPVGDAVRDLGEACLARMTEPEPGAPSKPDDLTVLGYHGAAR